MLRLTITLIPTQNRMCKSTIVFACVLLLTSCLGDVIFDSCHSLDSRQWLANDTVKFLQITIPEDSVYEGVLTMRVEPSFPYQEIGVEVRQLLYYGEEEAHRAQGIKQLICDTIICRIMDVDGKAEGDGVTILQYAFPVSNHHFAKGNLSDVFIRHIMNVDTIPDVTEIGYLLHPIN